MTDEFVEGYWWTPAPIPVRVPGTLTVEPSGKLTLSLVGAFGHLPPGVRNRTMVYGQTLKGGIVTLTGATLVSSQASGFDAAPRKEVLRAERLLEEVHLARDDDEVFVAAVVRIENLDVWAAFTEIQLQSEWNHPNAQVHTRDAEEFAHDGLLYRLRHAVGQFDFGMTRNGIEVSCPTRVVLEIESSEAVALNGFDDAIFAWVDFLSFATRDACAIVSIRLRHKEPKIVRRPVQVQRDDGSTTLRPEEREVEHLVTVRAHWTNAPKPAAEAKTNPFAFALTRRDRSVEDWFRKWTALRHRAKDGLDMLLSLTYGKNTFLQSDLLVVALGAETMHRGLFPDCLAMQPLDFETIINTATHGLAEEDAERIRRSFRNEPSYADRLRDLAALPHPDAVQVAVPNITQWARDLTSARNGLAHGLRKTNADLQHMYEVYERTRLLLELVVMAEIGVEPTHQEMHALVHRV